MVNKKLSRSSLNSFSKMIRRTFLEPFSSSKRIAFKHQQHHPHSTINEHLSRRKSTPLLNRHTNIFTIILTNFQPKRPKTSDNMIKNYIDTFINEYHPKQSNDNNENSQTNPLYYRHHSSSKIIRKQQDISSVNKSSTAFNQYIQTIPDIDDNEDSLPIENGQLTTNIHYIQRKSHKLTHVRVFVF
jgi:hypothetical protein